MAQHANQNQSLQGITKPTNTFRLLGKTYNAPFLKRTLTTSAEGLIKIIDEIPNAIPDSPLFGYHAIEAITGERISPDGQQEFCVAWEGDWPESVKHKWLGARDCLADDILEYRIEMAELDDAGKRLRAGGKVVGMRGKKARKVTADRIVLGAKRQVSRASGANEAPVATNNATPSAAANDTNAGAGAQEMSESAEDSMDDAMYEEIDFEEWLNLL
ncbi:hypothetical protein Q7P37_007404 [Cladosporium fusiforme]